MRFATLLLPALLSACGQPPDAILFDPPEPPDQFVILAPQERQDVGRELCARLRTSMARPCDVVASEGFRIDMDRTAATPGLIAFAAPEDLRDRDAVRPLRAVRSRPVMLFARRALDIENDAATLGLRVGATPDTLEDFEALMTGLRLSEADFEALYELEENDIADYAGACHPDRVERQSFDVFAATTDHPNDALKAMADDKDCRIRPIPIDPASIGAVIARRDDRMAVFVDDATLDAYRYRGDAYASFLETVDLAASNRIDDVVFQRIEAALGPAPHRPIE